MDTILNASRENLMQNRLTVVCIIQPKKESVVDQVRCVTHKHVTAQKSDSSWRAFVIKCLSNVGCPRQLIFLFCIFTIYYTVLYYVYLSYKKRVNFDIGNRASGSFVSTPNVQMLKWLGVTLKWVITFINTKLN